MKHSRYINKSERTLSLLRPLRLRIGVDCTLGGSCCGRLFVSCGFPCDLPPPPYDWWLYVSAGGGALTLLFLSLCAGDGLNSASSLLLNLSCLGLTLWFGGWSYLWFGVCAGFGFIFGCSLGLDMFGFCFVLLALSNITVNATSSCFQSPNLGTCGRFYSHTRNQKKGLRRLFFFGAMILED